MIVVPFTALYCVGVARNLHVLEDRRLVILVAVLFWFTVNDTIIKAFLSTFLLLGSKFVRHCLLGFYVI